jgi:hypothetical protein
VFATTSTKGPLPADWAAGRAGEAAVGQGLDPGTVDRDGQVRGGTIGAVLAGPALGAVHQDGAGAKAQLLAERDGRAARCVDVDRVAPDVLAGLDRHLAGAEVLDITALRHHRQHHEL